MFSVEITGSLALSLPFGFLFRCRRIRPGENTFLIQPPGSIIINHDDFKDILCGRPGNGIGQAKAGEECSRKKRDLGYPNG
jgi:hypothetical protein